IVIDTGEAKLMTPFFELEKLRQIEGFEEVRFLDPLGGSQGNSVRYMSVGEREANMQAKGISNLFLGGEKSGLFIGHTEAISTGSLAGYNASRAAAGLETLRLPKTLAIGELLDYGLEMLKEEDGLYHRFTFAGGEFLERMKERGLYRTSVREIRKIVEAEGLLGVYNRGRDVVE
ncbi:MAG: FAD-dependent oxidoreductase, partial [Firmicutes bacterium]|nr:FAD-dependent oxidoreductase [Bacillota bacterium]